MNTDVAKDYLVQAAARVEEEDRHLLVVDVSERCIATRLAMYLRDALSADYDVDVEYNRHGPDKKQLYDLMDKHDCDRDHRRDEGQTVLPDVIVHKRGVDSNLLIIEMKKSANRRGLVRDRRRIRAFRDELGYQFGALVVCKTGDRPAIDVEWYE